MRCTANGHECRGAEVWVSDRSSRSSALISAFSLWQARRLRRQGLELAPWLERLQSFHEHAEWQQLGETR
jgi:hypothetical protein